VIYAFDGHQLDTVRFELRRGSEVVGVEPQVFDVLRHLAANRDRVVEKAELLDEVWGTRFVTESALTSRIKAARRAVGDDGSTQRIIRTVHGRGYRFVAEVTEVDSTPSRSSTGTDGLVPPTQQVVFCRSSDGVRIAAATAGHGAPLVKSANWLTHVRYDWESIVWGHWLRDLSSRHQLVHYDERGCGLSDWDAPDVSFECWIRDLEAVVDEMGLERFPLLGISQGGAVAAAYAALHPERVSHLVLYGAFPQGRDVRARTDAERREAAMMLDLLESGWARAASPFGQMFASQFMPEGTTEQWEAFVELQERTTSAANARRLMTVSSSIDVTDLARSVQAPTLVLHAAGDRRVPIAQGELFASLIPGARLCPLDSVNHILLDGEPAWHRFLTELDAFLAT
jgi:DNA-binding winged helix-turn-helix (wHTH) protein/alpha-beta hydrolase superfamily lysophospholipase